MPLKYFIERGGGGGGVLEGGREGGLCFYCKKGYIIKYIGTKQSDKLQRHVKYSDFMEVELTVDI